MKKQFLEAGKIVNTHGIKGEVRLISDFETNQIINFYDIF